MPSAIISEARRGRLALPAGHLHVDAQDAVVLLMRASDAMRRAIGKSPFIPMCRNRKSGLRPAARPRAFTHPAAAVMIHAAGEFMSIEESSHTETAADGGPSGSTINLYGLTFGVFGMVLLTKVASFLTPYKLYFSFSAFLFNDRAIFKWRRWRSSC
jgi:hypothetical protein